MAGKKQHYIPQFLLRAFGRERKRGFFQVRAHFHDRSFVTATDGVAAEREFYSAIETDQDTLDDKITSAESEYAHLHRQLLDEETPDPVAAARLLTHLTVRGAHFRDSATFMAATMIEQMMDAFCDPEVFRRSLGLSGAQPIGAFKRALDKRYNELREKVGRVSLSRYEFQMLAHRMAQDKFEELFAENLIVAQTFKNLVMPDLPNTAAEGQRKGLQEDFEPEKRVESYSSMKWSSLASGGHEFILPDSVGAVMNEKGEYVAPLYVDTQKGVSVYFPLSSRKVLIGSKSEISVPKDSLSLNRIASRVSWDLFVSHPDTDVEPELERNIRYGTVDYLSEFIAQSLTTALAEPLS